MSVEFVDTNIFVYAHEGGAGSKHRKAVELVARLFEEQAGAIIGPGMTTCCALVGFIGVTRSVGGTR
jgi:predicted nucleic acid-binding protein